MILLSLHSCVYYLLACSRMGLNMGAQHHAPLGTDCSSVGRDHCANAVAWKVVLTVSLLANPKAIPYQFTVIIVIL